MPLIKPSFTIPGDIPYISGVWGPFLNTNLTSTQRRGLFMLLFLTIVICVAFASAAYMYKRSGETYASKHDGKECSEPEETDDSLGYFLNSNADLPAFFLGMAAGIVFGFVDNFGIYMGMNYLDPVFEPSKIPWVYGQNGGTRYFTGTDANDNVVYKDTNFLDGKLSSSQLKKIKKMSVIINDKYQKQLNLPEKQRESIQVNESAYSDPNSGMFLGAGIKKNDFIHLFSQRKLNERTYNKRINYYRNFRNDKVNKQLKNKSDKLRKQINQNSGILGTSLGAKKNFEKLKKEYYNIKPWPGADKSLADAALSGWTPGKLTQAGLGNTYSDALGGFLSTFIATMIVSATGQCTNSLISEVIGLIMGCLLGIVAGRSSWTPGNLS